MPPRPVVLTHPSSLAHDTGTHPESPIRIIAITDELQRRAWCGYEPISSPADTREVLERVHPADHIDRIAAVAQRGGGALDPDTVLSRGSYDAALHAAGGAVELVRRLVAGGPGAVGFSIHRPPGHHATTDRAMGFCLFNNIAIAARYALDRHGLERVMILDWDVHHGNGTQEIFWDTNQVLFCSIHQSPLYPGSGSAAEVGIGSGRGYTVNLPVPPGSGDAAFVSLVRRVAVPLARIYKPQLLLVSAGYDAHSQDPLADCNVDDDGFQAMATIARGLAVELGIPIGCVLEGGYNTGVLARCVAATMETLAAGRAGGAGGLPSAGSVESRPPHPLAADALQRLAALWPGLAG